MWGVGPAVVVAGGSVSVNTADLDSLASSLTSAAGSLDDARALVANAATDVIAAPPPSVSPSSTPNPIPGVFDMEKLVALQALDTLSTGPGSLQDVADTLRGIASDVTACSQAHALAEGKAAPVNGLVGPVDVRAFDSGLLEMALGAATVTQFPTISALLASSPAMSWLLYKLVEDSEDGQATVEVLQLLLSDPTTEQWVKEDLVRIVLLTQWLKNAKTGRETATVQAYLQQVSQRLDPWAKQRLPGQVAVGTQTVDTKSLTPMQRVAMVLGANAAAMGAGVYGTQSGITVTPVGGNGSTVLPPAAKDPFGLASAVNPGMTGKGKEAKSPQSISETITHCQEVQSSKNSLGQGYEEAGVISIQRVEHADGRVSWVVYVPGTTDWTSGDGEPQDLLTNLEAVGGTPTAMESGVVTAMRQAGIQPGEEVALYGHSQGGITVSNIAADPAIQERYNITTVLTAGSPTAGADIPDDVHALHLENTGDAVPGLDAAPTPTGPNRQVAMLDTHQMSTNGYPHASSAYAQAAEGLEDKAPELADWNTSFSRASGAGEQGTTTTEYTFAIQRNTDPNGIYKGGTTYQGKVPSAQPSYPRPTPSPQPTGEH
ncbi:hypothetical protein HMPREF2883_11260 [Actinomyces sp. HMSC075C01]|uniref:Alpha/beta hydrolase n=1 Tax=Actinomyces oris TaxID=544580 RepID=A0A1Q8VXX0_9ACTO|nr:MULTISPECIES: hypothetical protein [Actinomyces]OFR47398.1 hypothetical protein HMPREF2883_11260 [Actinomyces sp. HMSC075C01]OLO53141.1 hypothetical protein BKH27_07385 [Actinomyces oris]